MNPAPIVIHPETFVSEVDVGASILQYQPNFPIQGYLNPHHEYLSNLPDNALLKLTAPGLLDNGDGREIEGWLWQADGLKLYEMAYFANGDVLELGAFKGLSTCIMAQAILDAKRDAKIVTVDNLDHGWRNNADETNVSSVVEFRLGEAVHHLGRLIAEGRKFGFSFIDHSHTYADVVNACLLLPFVLKIGAFAQFHDYNDRRNGTDPDYGVWQAVRSALPGEFQFCGIYGCSGLYRYLG